ncbi:MAG: hypothetical protein LC102_08585 [Ignavibacteriales bacterium]|jgi:Uncharacterized protein conserved in bacteria|nr:MAG: hypothetical protein F9K26_04895 [Ignavibacteriaceae bacterium]MBW7872748.1 hypothetical protein [Ignavibacteria bacterium]MCZ2143468.1 hypothetical protein [Ignavibacteriales bacterium]OQY78111.1 MAG: hypothetical protein B6D45_02440 [Ignavibacteriales bacterium UTCHB3]MBV6444345.1 hypothetical protein [Ignavibacteriaceae bacterium]
MPSALRKWAYAHSGPLLKPASLFAWFFYSRFSDKIRLIIGSGDTLYKGWFPTDIKTLDLTNKKDFRRYFKKRKIDLVLIEHVLEHLEIADIEMMAQNIKEFANPNINIRVAVPDGFHADQAYIDHVRPGGTGPAADEHKHLFNYRSLSEIFVKFGYGFNLIEYWDEDRNFHSTYKNDDEKGHIKRCFLNHRKNKDGKPNYTSLIIDFYLTQP